MFVRLATELPIGDDAGAARLSCCARSPKAGPRRRCSRRLHRADPARPGKRADRARGRGLAGATRILASDSNRRRSAAAGPDDADGRVQRRRWRHFCPACRFALLAGRRSIRAVDGSTRFRLRARTAVLQQRICLRGRRRRAARARQPARLGSMPRSGIGAAVPPLMSRWSRRIFRCTSSGGGRAAGALMARAGRGGARPADPRAARRSRAARHDPATHADRGRRLAAVRAQYEANPYPRWIAHRSRRAIPSRSTRCCSASIRLRRSVAHRPRAAARHPDRRLRHRAARHR